MGAVREYDAKLDARKRLTIRDAGYEHYRVREFDDGTVVLQPRVLVSPNALTAKTLRDAEAGRDVKAFETAEELFADLESKPPARHGPVSRRRVDSSGATDRG